MKKIIFISVVLLLAGCSDTPSNKEFSDGSVEIIPEDLVAINKLESSILGNGDEIFSIIFDKKSVA